MSEDEALVDVLTGHASARFRYLDVRSVNSWRRERLPSGTNIPIERLADEAPKVFRRETDLVVYGEDNASTAVEGATATSAHDWGAEKHVFT